MTAADLATLRARACSAMAALGDTLDSLAVVEQTVSNPSDGYADALVISQQFSEAAAAAETCAAFAHDFALGVELACQLSVDRIAKFERRKGGAA